MLWSIVGCETVIYNVIKLRKEMRFFLEMFRRMVGQLREFLFLNLDSFYFLSRISCDEILHFSTIIKSSV